MAQFALRIVPRGNWKSISVFLNTISRHAATGFLSSACTTSQLCTRSTIRSLMVFMWIFAQSTICFRVHRASLAPRLLCCAAPRGRRPRGPGPSWAYMTPDPTWLQNRSDHSFDHASVTGGHDADMAPSQCGFIPSGPAPLVHSGNISPMSAADPSYSPGQSDGSPPPAGSGQPLHAVSLQIRRAHV